MKIQLFETIDSIGLSRRTLMFKDQDLEQQFIEDQVYSSKELFRFSVIIALGAFILFSAIDFIYAGPDLWAETLAGLVAISALTIATIVITNTRKLVIYARPTVSLAIFLIGLSSVYFVCVDTGEYHFKNYLGLFLVFAYAFSFLKLGFFFSALPCGIIYVLYNVVTFTIIDYSMDELIIYHSFISFAFTIIAISGYINEAHLRNEYFLKKQLDAERAKVNEQNIALEAEVEKRTTELVRINKALTRAKLKAEGSEQLKTAFLANISHEIRTPVTKLVGFSELIVNDSLPVGKRAKYSQNIEDGANQLIQMINDLLELSRVESKDISLQLQEVSLQRLFTEVKDLAVSEIHKQNKQGVIEFHIEPEADESLDFFVDKIKLHQILRNFLSNAVKFTEFGSITFHCQERKDGMLEFCIEDTGIGIKEENFELVFSSFHQVEGDCNRQYGGAGIGLALNKGIIHAMGGKVWLKSKAGKGSKFYFTIPLHY